MANHLVVKFTKARRVGVGRIARPLLRLFGDNNNIVDGLHDGDFCVAMHYSAVYRYVNVIVAL